MNPLCPICEGKLRHVEGEFGADDSQFIFWVCDCGFRDLVHCPRCHDIVTTYLRNGVPDVPSPLFFCDCGFLVVPEVAS